MQTRQLVQYIFESKANLFVSRFARAIDSSPLFKEFMKTYRDKIRKKMRLARGNDDSDEAIRDILAEIEIAYLLLLVDRFSKVEYECYGTEEQNPDLAVTDDRTGITFNVEVKRIRRTDLEKRFEHWKWEVAQQITTVESGLACSIDVGELGVPSGLLDRLESEKGAIIDFIKSTIVQAESEIPVGDKATYSVPGLEGLVSFELSKPEGKTSPSTSYYGGSFPIFVTHREYRKFGDEICDPEHLGQMRPGMVNILAIATDSGTHDVLDLGKAIASLRALAAQGNDSFFTNKGFSGVTDFLAQIKRLSGILFRSAWVEVGYASNALWNNDAAECLLPKDIGEALKDMDYPR